MIEANGLFIGGCWGILFYAVSRAVTLAEDCAGNINGVMPRQRFRLHCWALRLWGRISLKPVNVGEIIFREFDGISRIFIRLFLFNG